MMNERRVQKLKDELSMRMREMEGEIKKQRDRTVAIVLDKDKEIKILKGRLGIFPTRSKKNNCFSLYWPIKILKERCLC